MNAAKLDQVVRQLRASAGGSAPIATDRRLLEDFCSPGDQMAFAALVARHGKRTAG